MNPLDQYPYLRKVAYNIQWVGNLILGVIGIVLTAQGMSPSWFVITGLAWNFVCSYTGITASSHVSQKLDPPVEPKE